MKHFFSSKFRFLIIVGFTIVFCGYKKNDISTIVGTPSEGQYLPEVDYYSLYGKAQSKGTFTYDADCLQSSQLLVNLDTVVWTNPDTVARKFINYVIVNNIYYLNGTYATDIIQSRKAVSGSWVNLRRAAFHYQNGNAFYSSVVGEAGRISRGNVNINNRPNEFIR